MALIGAAPTAATAQDMNRQEYDMVDQIIEKLDITTFPNLVGPRREPEKHTFADYGFVRVQKQMRGAVLTEAEGGWEMSFNIVATAPDVVDICLRDKGLTRPSRVLNKSAMGWL